jgi:hypothetical protein
VLISHCLSSLHTNRHIPIFCILHHPVLKDEGGTRLAMKQGGSLSQAVG